MEDEVVAEPEKSRPAEEDEFNVSDGDEMADFIDDDDREGGGQRRRARRQRTTPGVSSRGVDVSPLICAVWRALQEFNTIAYLYSPVSLVNFVRKCLRDKIASSSVFFCL